MQVIEKALAGLKLGTAQVHLNLAFVPLIDERESAPDYLLLDEALEAGLARVTEVTSEGRVPELAFENASAGKILLVDGDELVGAKQNRILNLTILVAGGKRLVIPVSCVEQRRWNYRRKDFQAASGALFAKARAKKTRRVSESLRAHGERRSNQSEIWADVADKVSFCRVESDTLAMSDIYEQTGEQLAAYASAFRAEPKQRGAVIAIDGRVAGLELFDSSRTFRRYLEKLVRSYALDAIETARDGTLVPKTPDVRAFLDAVSKAEGQSFEALGEGTDIRFDGGGITGAALASGKRIVHLAGFAAV